MKDIIIIIFANYLFLLSIAIGILYFLKINIKLKRRLFITTAFSFPISYIVAKISGLLIYDPRPFVVKHITPLFSHAPDNGFPSDHTLLTMAIASVIFIYNKKLGIILAIIALCVGLARVFANIHHMEDILGSSFIAISVTVFVYLGQKFFMKTSSS